LYLHCIEVAPLINLLKNLAMIYFGAILLQYFSVKKSIIEITKIYTKNPALD